MNVQLLIMRCFLCYPAQMHWTIITLHLYYYQRNIEWISKICIWVENWIRCFSCVPSVNVQNCPYCLPFVPDPISAAGGDSFVIYFTLSYLHAIILVELPVLNLLLHGGSSNLSAKACLILEGHWCHGLLPALSAFCQFWMLVLCEPPVLVVTVKLYFSDQLWVCLKNVSGSLQ